MTNHSDTTTVAKELEDVFAPLRGRYLPNGQPDRSKPPLPKRRLGPLPWLVGAALFGLGIAGGSIIAGTINDISSFKSSVAAAARGDKVRATSARPIASRDHRSGGEGLKTDDLSDDAPMIDAFSLDATLDSKAEGKAVDPMSRIPALAPVAPVPSVVPSAQFRPADRESRARSQTGRQGIVFRDGAELATPPCDPEGQESLCDFQDVLRADAELRRAYDRATRDGVSARWLAGLVRQWDRARDGADIDPDEAVLRYQQLAGAIDRKRFEEVR